MNHSAVLLRLRDDFPLHRAGLYGSGYLISWQVFALALVLMKAGPMWIGVCALLPAGCGVLAFGVLSLALPHYLVASLRRELDAAQMEWRCAEPQEGTISSGKAPEKT